MIMKRKTLLFLSLFLPLSTVPALWAEEEQLTPAEMLKRLQEKGGEQKEDAEAAASAWPDGLPKDMPLYPGVEHEPLQMFDGYYRFNIQAPTSDRASIIETFREEAKKKGWTVKQDQKESENTHAFHFTKGNGNLVVKVSNDGVETKAVYYEFMTDEFMESVRKRRK